MPVLNQLQYKFVFAIVGVCLFFLLPQGVDAATLSVPGQYASIQAAVTAAATGDTINVAAGTYNENVTINKVVTILGTGYSTTVSSLKNNPVKLNGNFTVTAGSTVWNQGTVIRGFAVTGADPFISKSPFTVEYNYLRPTSGDGISFETGGGGSAKYNFVEGSGDDSIDVDNQAKNIWIEGNTLLNSGQDGLETRQQDVSIPSLVRLTFINNRVEGSGQDGIQIMDYNNNSSREYFVARNLFLRNGKAGIGIMAADVTNENYSAAAMPERLYLFNNTFVDNNAGLSGGANVVAVNNIFTAGTGSVFLLKNVGGSSVIASSLLSSQAGASGTVNLNAGTVKIGDPKLDTNFVPGTGSPAIDAGVSTYSHGGTNVLTIAANEYSGSAPDMGYKESGLSAPVPSTTPAVTTQATPAVTGSLTQAPGQCRKAEGDANCDGTINLVDYDYYRRRVLGNAVPAAVSADFNGDGETGTLDLDILKQTLGIGV